MQELSCDEWYLRDIRHSIKRYTDFQDQQRYEFFLLNSSRSCSYNPRNGNNTPYRASTLLPLPSSSQCERNVSKQIHICQTHFDCPVYIIACKRRARVDDMLHILVGCDIVSYTHRHTLVRKQGSGRRVRRFGTRQWNGAGPQKARFGKRVSRCNVVGEVNASIPYERGLLDKKSRIRKHHIEKRTLLKSAP
jgi:hypothetical protein